ncbi:hypothetical protein GGR58DRAFT_194249 [Xylaria digitata]|nr:hypothetical protein GGR58DRAFT_194249 [Xylaria digitata]
MLMIVGTSFPLARSKFNFFSLFYTVCLHCLPISITHCCYPPQHLGLVTLLRKHNYLEICDSRPKSARRNNTRLSYPIIFAIQWNPLAWPPSTLAPFNTRISSDSTHRPSPQHVNCESPLLLSSPDGLPLPACGHFSGVPQRGRLNTVFSLPTIELYYMRLA